MRGKSKDKARAEVAGVRCGIYTRKSTVKGLEIAYNSLEAQEDICKGFIERHEGEGWQHVQTYCDAGLSGGNTERPALRRMLQDAREGRLDCVVVFKLDRLARNHRDFVNLLAELGECGVDVASVTENFDCRGPLGQAIRHFLGVFAEMERSIIRERCRERAEAARMRGIYLGSRPPYGYRKVEGRLVAEPGQVEVVRRIFRLYAGGMGSVQLAARLNGRGELRPCVGVGPPRPWNSRTVLHVLKNPVYMGCIRSGAEYYDGQHEPLVSRTLWQQVQNRLSEVAAEMRARMIRAQQVPYPLRGVLVCAGCGRKMGCYHQRKQGRRYYVCNTRRKHGPGSCSSFSLNADKVEQLLLGLFRSVPERRCARLALQAESGCRCTLEERFGNVFNEVLYHARDGVLTLRMHPGAEAELSLPPRALPEGAEYQLATDIRSRGERRQPRVDAPRPGRKAVCLANAMRMEELLCSGAFESPAAMARALGLSRSLIYDRLELLNLPPADMEQLLFGGE